jgi:hypothetical protein
LNFVLLPPQLVTRGRILPTAGHVDRARAGAAVHLVGVETRLTRREAPLEQEARDSARGAVWHDDGDVLFGHAELAQRLGRTARWHLAITVAPGA